MKLLISEVKERILFLTLNRPEVRNALNHELISCILRELKKYEKNSHVRALVLKGSGDIFCSGGDIQWLKELGRAPKKKNLLASKHLENLFFTLNKYPKPVLGLVQGAALGGGFGLVSVCDYVIAEKNTVFSLSELRIGIVPSVILPFVLSKIGESHTRALMLTGQKWSASVAQSFGLIHEIAQTYEEMESCAQAGIENFLKSGPQACKLAKSLIQDVKIIHGQTLRRKLIRILAEVRATREAQEGFSAFLNKQSPRWL